MKTKLLTKSLFLVLVSSLFYLSLTSFKLNDQQNPKAPSGDNFVSTSVCAIVVSNNSNEGTQYYKSYYKVRSSTGNYLLYSSNSYNSNLKGTARRNSDRTRAGFNVSSYSYVVVSYFYRGVTWYYYFN